MPITDVSLPAVPLADFPPRAGEVGIVDRRYAYGNAKRHGAAGDSITFDDVALQNMITSAAALGVQPYIPRGWYALSTNLHNYTTDGMIIRGDGIGRTILDGSGIADANRHANPNWLKHSATISFASSTADTRRYDCGLTGLTIKGPTTGTPGHSLAANNVIGFTASEVDFNGSVGETFYITGQNKAGANRNISIRNCLFRNVLSAAAPGCIDTNTTRTDGLTIEGCTFDTVHHAIAALGRNVRIHRCTMRRVRHTGIEAGESNTDATASLRDCTISDIAFTELGYGSAGVGQTTGIYVATRSKVYEDGSRDDGILISNVTFVDGRAAADSGLVCVRANGPCTVRGCTAVNFTGPSVDYRFFFSWDGRAEEETHVYLENNKVMRAREMNYTYGCRLAQTANTFIHSSHNRWDVGRGHLAMYFTPGTYGSQTTHPTVIFDGDMVTGSIALWDGPNANVNDDAAFDLVPLYGSTAGEARTYPSTAAGVSTRPKS